MQTMTGSYSEILERPSLPERIVEEDEKGKDENEIDDSKDEVSIQRVCFVLLLITLLTIVLLI